MMEAAKPHAEAIQPRAADPGHRQRLRARTSPAPHTSSSKPLMEVANRGEAGRMAGAAPR